MTESVVILSGELDWPLSGEVVEEVFGTGSMILQLPSPLLPNPLDYIDVTAFGIGGSPTPAAPTPAAATNTASTLFGTHSHTNARTYTQIYTHTRHTHTLKTHTL